VKVEGAGQRLHFSFGGKVKLFNNGKMKGYFRIISHPLAPEGTDRLVVTCNFDEFKNATLAGPRLEFDGFGHCRVLELDGSHEKIPVKNHFVIVDAPGGSDQIDVEIIGNGGGIMIPGGDLAFGNFTFGTH
jgi:hypothetical protein